MDTITRSFFKAQHRDAMALAAASDILELYPRPGSPPQHYIAVFHAKGLILSPDGGVVEATRFDFGIALPDDYLRRADADRVVSYLGPHPRPFHPNIIVPYVCIDVAPAMPLEDLLYALYELSTWQLFGTRDNGINPAAAQWARNQDPSRFPIDRRPLKRRSLRLDVTPRSGGRADGRKE